MYSYGSDAYRIHWSDLVSQRQDSESEPYIILTPEWCAVFEKIVQYDERYKQVAKNWEGSVVLVFLADTDAGLKSNLYLFLDLWHGDCNIVQQVPETVGRSGEYVLEAEYRRWEQIMKGELNVVKELATRQLKLMPFDFKKAVKLAAASQAAIRLVELAGTVGARYLTDLADEDRTEFEQLMTRLNTDYGV